MTSFDASKADHFCIWRGKKLTETVVSNEDSNRRSHIAGLDLESRELKASESGKVGHLLDGGGSPVPLSRTVG